MPEQFQNEISNIERGKIDTTNTQMYDNSLSLFGTGTSIKSDRLKLVSFLLGMAMITRLTG
jgi:hypothetical protein